ncbi:MAG: protein translocase SEC61 complex subunit gamma [Candidatus Diapherotrites archaeon]|nr:protein translocase SEC61 complex subunit gamma [Candidatus Diapherotrites archaeon]
MAMGLRDFIESTRRVLTVAKKPDRQEYFLMLKITLLGVIIIGLLGFFIGLLFSFLGVGRVA